MDCPADYAHIFQGNAEEYWAGTYIEVEIAKDILRIPTTKSHVMTVRI